MTVMGCRLSQPNLVVQGSARSSAPLPDRQGPRSTSRTNSSLSLPPGSPRPYRMDSLTEQNISFVPPALTTSTENMLLVMPGPCSSSFMFVAAASGSHDACRLSAALE